MPFKIAHPFYACWHSMLQRCENKKSPSYHRYGGRGIAVCSRWSIRGGEGFRNFVSDMGSRPDGYSLDRIDNEKGYFPENCRWATRSEQQLNKFNTRKVVIDGVVYKSAELAKIIGVKPDTITARAEDGLSLQQVLSTKRRIFTDGLALGGKANGARQKAKTHCPQGHPYIQENLLPNKLGFRSCKICHKNREAAKREAERRKI